jgi:hypothetical protein
MLTFAGIISYYSYRPIKALVKQYESKFTSEVKSKNEFTQISLLLNSAFEKSRNTSTELAEKMERLESQRGIIRQQFIQLLFKGEIDENISEHVKYLDIPFANPYYSVLIIPIEPENIEKIEETAHNIKALASSISADKVKTLAFRIELAARRGNQSEAALLYEDLNDEFGKYEISINEAEDSI